MKKFALAVILVLSATANADIKREDYASYIDYLNAVSESNAQKLEQLNTQKQYKCAGVSPPKVGAKKISLFCAGAKKTGSTSTLNSHSIYYSLGSSFYIVESGRIVYVRNY